MRKTICKNLSSKKSRHYTTKEKNWKKIEKAADYLVKTSNPEVDWQDLLGKKNESYY